MDEYYGEIGLKDTRDFYGSEKRDHICVVKIRISCKYFEDTQVYQDASYTYRINKGGHNSHSSSVTTRR